MPNLQELLKNAQVEWKTLGEVLKYEQPNNYIVKSTEYNDQFSTPVLTAGQTFILGYTDETQGVFHADKQNPVIIFDDFTASNKWIDFDFKVKSSAMKLLKAKDKSVILRYCYHYMQTIKFDNTEHRRIWISQYSNIKIPIPSLEVQAEIVRILDTFAELTAELTVELTAELTLRKKQYRYYLEKLLSEEYLRECSEKVGGEVEWKELSEVADYYDGKHQTPKYTHSGVPFISVENIKNIYGTNKYISKEEFSTFKAKPAKDDIFMTRIGNIGSCALVQNDDDLAYYVTLALIKPNKKIILSKFLKFFIESTHGKKELDKRILHTAISIKINLRDIGKIILPLPPLSVQSHIVGILEKFEHMVQEVSGLLPQEIALRKKQYEYYRDKLLSFNLSWPDCDNDEK